MNFFKTYFVKKNKTVDDKLKKKKTQKFEWNDTICLLTSNLNKTVLFYSNLKFFLLPIIFKYAQFFSKSFFTFTGLILNDWWLFIMHNSKRQCILKPIKYNTPYQFEKQNKHVFVNLLIRNGLKLSAVSWYTCMFSLFYKNFFAFNKYLLSRFPLYRIFFNLSKFNTIFYSTDYFYQILIHVHELIFYAKITEFPKKLKTPKSKYTITFSYLHPHNRFRWLFKNLILNNTQFFFFKFSDRLYYSLLTVLLNPDDNFVKEQQKKIYKNFIKNKKIA